MLSFHNHILIKTPDISHLEVKKRCLALLLIRKAVSKSLTYGHIGKIIINRRGKISTVSHFLCVTLSTLATERVEQSDFTTGLRSYKNSRIDTVGSFAGMGSDVSDTACR
jgi:hypothetical protein